MFKDRANGWAEIESRDELRIRVGPASVESGFTLIEALSALTIFAFVLGGLSYLLLTTAETNAQARRLTAATQLAEAKLEELRSMGPAGVTSGADANPLTEAGVAGGIYSRRWTAGAGPVAGTAAVAVIIEWTDKDGPHTVRLQTII